MSMVQLPLPFKVKKSIQFYPKKTIDDDVADNTAKSKRGVKRHHDHFIDVDGQPPVKASKAAGKPKNDKNPLKITKPNLILQNASNALHGNTVSRLPCREKELEILENFLMTHFSNEKSGSIYISGPPGTGKTASLLYLLEDQRFKSYKTIYVNCAALKSARSIYQKIALGLKMKVLGKTEKAYLASIEQYLESKHKMILLILDEIDQLDSVKQSVLYTIFDWPSNQTSNLVLVGIANALDLTDRMLPRLQKKLQLRPKLLHFSPYTKEQIVEILTARLNDGATNVFSPVALQLLAAKVAALSGDVRRALDLARLVIEAASKGDTPLDALNDTNASVEVKQVLQVLDVVYGTAQKLENDLAEAFPLQQKLLICSLLLVFTKGKTKDVTVGKLYEVYNRVGKKRNIAAVDSVEFPSLCELVQTRGIIKLTGKKEPRTRKITLNWDENEVHGALKDKKLISDIINDVSCLSQ